MLKIELFVYITESAEPVERQEAARLLQMAADHVKAGDSLPDAIGSPKGIVHLRMRREP
jgi:hypothetical protein